MARPGGRGYGQTNQMTTESEIAEVRKQLNVMIQAGTLRSVKADR